ncbi:ribosomal RNA small subunit methyltransferase NEP1 [Rosa chinensis]|uniref:ribosomal RNA small subunit methyltransferase NEP1 n=1 Tax=Rosa chinensis TaxID=74649 RepID=UPI000D08F089|nr:ribosomal RNA small subunit methyltransferase NEP1 [Rosa chinensis]
MAQMGKSELASAKKPKGAAGNTGLVSGKAGESGKATSGSGMMEFHKVAFCDLQALHMVLDSPINKAGKLRGVYMKTKDVQLLQKLSTSVVGKREKLMRMIKNPMTQYLPVNSRKWDRRTNLVYTEKDIDEVRAERAKHVMKFAQV